MEPTNNLINLKVWGAIDKDLGEVTDVELINFDGYSRINYKSNGEQRKISIGGNNIRVMLQSLIYCFEALGSGEKQYQVYY